MYCNICHYGSEAFKGPFGRKCPNCKHGTVILSRSPFPNHPTKKGSKGHDKGKKEIDGEAVSEGYRSFAKAGRDVQFGPNGAVDRRGRKLRMEQPKPVEEGIVS